MDDVEGVRYSRREEFHERTTTLQQFRALFLKDLTLQWRSWRTNLCQFLTPVIFVLFVGLMQVIVNKILSDHNNPIPGTEVPLPPVNPGMLLACDLDNTSFHHPEHCRKEVFNIYKSSSLPTPSIAEDIEWICLTSQSKSSQLKETCEWLKNFTVLLPVLSQEPCQKVLFDLPLVYVGSSGDLGNDFVLGNFTSSEERNGLVGHMVPDSWFYNFSLEFEPDFNTSEETCPSNYSKTISLPVFWEAESQEKLNEHLGEIVKDYNKLAVLSASSHDQYGRTYSVTPLSESQYYGVMKYIVNRDLDKVKPRGGIFFDKFLVNSSSVDIAYTMVADDLAVYTINLGEQYNTTIGESYLKIDVHRRNALINMVDNAIFKYLRNASEDDDEVLITTYIMPIPVLGPQMNITIDIASILGGILYPFSASFLIPVFMSSIVKDKHEKHLIMMEQNGLSRWTYWLVTYTFNFLLYIPVAVEIAVFSLLFKFRLFTQTNSLVLFLTFFLWGHAEVVLGFFLSSFFNRPRTATIVGYLLVIAGVTIALIIEGIQIFPQDKTPFPVYMMYPPFAFYRILDYLINACLTLRCYGIDTFTVGSGLNLVTTAMLYLIGSTIVLMILSVYLSYVFPGEYGVKKSPFFPIIDCYKWIKLRVSRRGTRQYNLELERVGCVTPPVSPGRLGEDEEAVDIDVQAEEDAIADRFPDDAPMVMHQLRKEYQTTSGNAPYVAVHSMSLVINRNECFGLLGPNGAGKTTLISVLTGLYEPTSGTARIAGYDITTEISAIHSHLGVCPQFDIHHAELTAEEHLLFYARLKGVKRSKEKQVVERVLRQVNLFDARKRKSKNLSGGMRRRLSVAMACIGNPDILILDEPTTGLDPASRRQVWEVIEAVKEGRSVILTTHAMEEADQLCTRIGIMNFGKLRCLGTQSRLKTRFGSGYQLTFNCSPGQVREVENFVQLNLPNAVHVESYSDSCTFKLEKDQLKVSEIFPMINREKARLGILDWGVKMTTLEDVFLKIVKSHGDYRTQPSNSILPDWLPCKHCLQRRKGQANE